jgi:catalase
MALTGIGRAAVLGAALLWLSPAPARAADEVPLPEQIVDIMNQLWGRHAGFRANHAKGLVAEGRFTPSGAGAALSTASLLQGAATPVTVRFSDATGLPAIPDGAGDANPHGLSLKFHLADGSEMDIVANSLKLFPVATGEAFRDLLQAVLDSGPGVARPTPVERFVAAHPAVPRALASVATPVSLARETYNGINAFVFVDGTGKRQPFRFRIAPVLGNAHLAPADAARQPVDFLMDEMGERLAREPVAFRLLAQIAEPGDPTDDPTRPWPEDRELVDLGGIDVTGLADAETDRTLLFLPSNVPGGIEPSDDPLIELRSEAYPISFARRSE